MGAMETEMNVMLIIVLVVMMMLLLFCVGILIVKFGHPNDKNQAKFPKAIVALGLWMAFASILVLPYDVANARGSGGGIRVDIIWQILYAMVHNASFSSISSVSSSLSLSCL